MKTTIITLAKGACLFLFLISFQMEKTYSQVVTTFIEQYPGDGEMSFDDQGFIYVNESEVNGNLVGDAVWKVDSQTGNFSEFRSNLPIWVVGSSFDLNGDLLVTGWSAGIITKISADGSTIQEFASNINGAGSLEVDENGNVYVAEFLDNSVLKYDSNQILQETYTSPGNITRPAGLAYLQSTGDLYVSNWENGKISIIDSKGVISNFSQVPSLNGGPIKIFGDYLYITSPLRHIIYRIPLNDPQDVQVFSGIIDSPGHNNGPIATATYDTPTGIGSMDGGNTIYISEKFNGAAKLRRINNVLGVADQELFTGVKLFPNPTNHKLLLENIHTGLGDITTSIYDTNGRKLELPSNFMNENTIEFIVDGLDAGIYFVTIQYSQSDKSTTYSFIKK